MTEQRRKKIVYVALVLAIIYGAYNFWPESTDKPEANAKPAVEAKMPTEASAVTAALSAIVFDTAALEAAPWGSDPFRVSSPPPRTPKTVSQAAPSWRLSGILYNQNNPLAIIDGKPVGVGDQVKGATVVDIERKRVTLDLRGKQYTLTVSKG